MIEEQLLTRVQTLIAERQPFVLATVVQAWRPTSVRHGDSAVILSDGTIEGFVGGVCATSSVRLHALRALETGESLLLRLVPGNDADGEAVSAEDGAVIEHNPCLSGGALELFLEPHLPAARLAVIGNSPIAHALERLGQTAGYDIQRRDAGGADAIEGAAAVIVASHGNTEEAVLAAALEAGVPYVALVASQKRGNAVRADLAIPDELRSQLHTPAGLAIGARTPEEIAVSILAELVAQQHSEPTRSRPDALGAAPTPAPGTVTGPAPGTAPAEATDPVCGMRVAVSAATPQVRAGSEVVFFCSESCRDRYAREHADAIAR